MKKLSIVIFTILIDFLFIGNTAFALTYPTTATPTKSSVNVRSETSMKSKKVDTVGKKDIVTVTGESVDGNGSIWYSVELTNGSKGYISGEYLSFAETQLLEYVQNSNLAGKTQNQPKAQAATHSQPKSKSVTVTVKASCSDKNHVGNKWSQEFYVNDEKIKSSKKMTFTVGEEVEFYSVITETDKSPDEGGRRETRVITEDDLKKGFKIEQTVEVTEDRGRYAGNICYWEVVFTVK